MNKNNLIKEEEKGKDLFLLSFLDYQIIYSAFK